MIDRVVGGAGRQVSLDLRPHLQDAGGDLHQAQAQGVARTSVGMSLPPMGPGTSPRPRLILPHQIGREGKVHGGNKGASSAGLGFWSGLMPVGPRE
jgi:hypothetical protein